MKHTRRDRQRRAGEPCTSDSYGAEFATTARKNNCSFIALSSVRWMAAGDRSDSRFMFIIVILYILRYAFFM